ncbi:type IV fimbrial biogenesis protein FimT [Candidatus Magnetomoraceae bacterium gMMP-15]
MKKKKQAGMTLIELIVVIAILAVLIGVAVPNFMVWLPEYKLKDAARDMLSTMQLARLRAVKENANVIVDFSDSNQYIAFVDNGEGGGTVDDKVQNGNEKTIKIKEIPDEIEVHDVGFSGGSSKCKFSSRGFPSGFGGHVYLKNNQDTYMGIKVNSTGNIRIVKSSDGEDWD